MAADFGNFEVFLFDIEGTVCPISFVKEVLFPYALDALPKTLEEQWDAPEFAQYRNAFPEEYRNDKSAFEAHVHDLVARDVKAPYLKALQGHLWLRGYQSGDIVAPLFADVDPFFKHIVSSGAKVMIYSSGSVPAQKLLFGHTNSQPKDMQHLISDWFDTVNAGPKMEASSYKAIMAAHPEITKDPAKWLFFSDNLAEVEAALDSGMRSLPVVRPGNAQLPPDHRLTAHAIHDYTAQSAEKGWAAIAQLSA